MSDEERSWEGSEEESEEEVEEPKPKPKSDEPAPVQQSGDMSEAEQLMQERKREHDEKIAEEIKEYEEMRREERQKQEEEIRTLRERRERRKVERAEEEKRLQELRIQEDKRRKEEEEARQKKKQAEEQARRDAKMAKQRELDKLMNPPKPNFVISKKSSEVGEEGSTAAFTAKSQADAAKSKEQQEEERKAVLAQRIQPLEISGFDAAKLADKAKDLYDKLYHLESEKYDLEERFKRQQYDMMELAERARQMNKGGGGGRGKTATQTGYDKLAEKYAGAPPKIQLFSQFERRKDKRSYDNRRELFTGPMYATDLWNKPKKEGEAPAEAPAPEEAPAEEAEAEA